MIFTERNKTYLVSLEEELEKAHAIQIYTPFISSLSYIDGVINAEYDFSSTQNIFITVETKADIHKIQKQIKRLWEQQ